MLNNRVPEEIENWIFFADEDLRSAEIMLREKIFNKVCFLSEQCAQKALKAFLLYKNILPQKTHKLVELLSTRSKLDNDYRQLEDGCLELDRYYLPTRYPDAIVGSLPEGLPKEENAVSALKIARTILEFVENKILKV